MTSEMKQQSISFQIVLPKCKKADALGNPCRHLHPPAISLQNCKTMRGYAYTLESATVLLLLLISLPAMEAFKLQSQDEQGFFLCYDAAGVLAKAFYKGEDLQQTAQQLSSLSGMCISAKGPQEASSCDEGTPKEKFAFTFPIDRGGAIWEMSVQCFWQ